MFRVFVHSSVRMIAKRFATLVVIAATIGLAFGNVGCGKDSTGPEGLEPVLNAIEPDSGTVGTEVQIIGADFASGLGVRFGDIEATSITVVSPTTLLVHAPDGLVAGTAYDLTVTNPGGRLAALPGAYRAVPPDLDVVNGVARPSGLRGSTILFEGHAFGDLVGKGSAWFTADGGQPVAADFSAAGQWTNDFIVATVPQSAVTGPVWIETPTGTSRTVQFILSEAATFSPSQIFWTETTPLPSASQGHKAVFLSGEDAGRQNVIFVTGGADGSLSPRNQVLRAQVDQTGAISSWLSEASLPESRAFHGMALATPYNALVDTMVAGHLFVAGGLDASGAPTRSVFRAAVSTDRAVGSWTEEAMLPAPLHSMGIAVFRSWLYVTGGATLGHEAVAEVHRAHIEPDGHLGPWESQATLPEPRSYASLIQFADVLYMVGGERGTTPPQSATTTTTETADILRAKLGLRTAEIEGSWSLNPSSLIKAVAKHTALVAGGTVLVSGGLYNGARNSATEHQYAEINPDGTISSFNGATGSQTITSAGGVPFFNHAAITYVDAAGGAHVVILGGNDVEAPTTPTDRNYYY